MLFSSMIFLWVFLPIVLVINYAFNLIVKNHKLKMRLKNTFLLIASLFFYAWGGVYYLSIMICSIIINYVGGYVISKLGNDKNINQKIVLIITVALNLLILGYFKYFNMIVVIIEQMMEHNDFVTFWHNILYMKGTGALGLKEVILPIGISFFTFQAMSYVIDVYRCDAKAQKNILDFGLYVALFPQLIAGPIVRYHDVALQINDRNETSDKFRRGIKRFCYGIGKKVLIANTFALVVDKIWALDLSNIGSAIAILATISYTFQIYYDFSGYSDMAIGLGLMFGFEFKENFNYPYLSSSITDFWRRWHISLSTWFKEYVYIPLGGNRHGLFRTCLNLMIVFLLTGIWHGANFTFILWGIIYGIIQIIEKLFLLKILKANKLKFLNFIYMMIITLLLFMLFRSNNIHEAGLIFSQYFIPTSKYNVLSYISMKYIITLIVAILSMGVIQNIFKNLYDKIKNNTIVNVIDALLQFMILFLAIISIVDGTYNPFIYFQF
ncbi:MAG: MBOAT family protein [Lachnospiraceae bacterium]|nr:MBOAT family protein [Lachnospiraceae bacterium]